MFSSQTWPLNSFKLQQQTVKERHRCCAQHRCASVTYLNNVHIDELFSVTWLRNDSYGCYGCFPLSINFVTSEIPEFGVLGLGRAGLEMTGVRIWCKTSNYVTAHYSDIIQLRWLRVSVMAVLDATQLLGWNPVGQRPKSAEGEKGKTEEWGKRACPAFQV